MPLKVPNALQYILGPGSSWKDVGGAVLDGAVVSYVVYRILLLIRGTRAIQVLIGLILLGVAYFASQWANLVTLNWLLGHFLSYSFLFGVIVLFQADIRRGLARLGRTGLVRLLAPDDRQEHAGVVEAVARAASELARRRRGALVVIERVADLSDVAETGVRVEAELSSELLVTLFEAGSPLHDGAVVVRRGRVAAARCLLPLTTSHDLDDVGTRHRAALGLAEEVDAVVVVVSEERGEISLAFDGVFHRAVQDGVLREWLAKLLVPPGRTGVSALVARLGRGRSRGKDPAEEDDRAAV
jgi:diadenylate cyclase